MYTENQRYDLVTLIFDPWFFSQPEIWYKRSLHLWINVDIHLPFKFQPPTTNIKRFRYFRWRVSIYRSVAHKTGSRSSHLLNTFRRGSPDAHFVLYFIALWQILQILWACDISSFTLHIWPLTLTFDMVGKCLDEKSIWDPSRIIMWGLVFLTQEIWNYVIFRKFQKFDPHYDLDLWSLKVNHQ